MFMALRKHSKEREKWEPMVVVGSKEHLKGDYIPTRLGKPFGSQSLVCHPRLPRIGLIRTGVPGDVCHSRNISKYACISLFVFVHERTSLSLTINSKQKSR